MCLCAITTFFNPANYKSRLVNYRLFADQLARQGVDLLTVELIFGDDPCCLPESDNILRLHSQSVMWQKERLLNHALSRLPDDCDMFAWIDCDLLFPDNWAEILADRLRNYDVCQLFEKVVHLPPGCVSNKGVEAPVDCGIVWQAKNVENWLARRQRHKLPYTTPGFAWAAKRAVFRNGFYDRLICGNGDTLIADCLLDSFGIHHYYKKLTTAMHQDQLEWRQKFGKPSVGYLPVDLCHLWHGAIENRKYVARDEILLQNDFDPNSDIALRGEVYEFSSDKPRLHRELKEYFYGRKEDDVE